MKKMTFLLGLLPLLFVSCGKKKTSDLDRIRNCTNQNHYSTHITECSSVYNKYAQLCYGAGQYSSNECIEFNRYQITLEQNAQLYGSAISVPGVGGSSLFGNLTVTRLDLSNIGFTYNGVSYYGKLRSGTRIYPAGTSASSYNQQYTTYNNTTTGYANNIAQVSCSPGTNCKQYDIRVSGQTFKVYKGDITDIRCSTTTWMQDPCGDALNDVVGGHAMAAQANGELLYIYITQGVRKARTFRLFGSLDGTIHLQNQFAGGWFNLERTFDQASGVLVGGESLDIDIQNPQGQMVSYEIDFDAR